MFRRFKAPLRAVCALAAFVAGSGFATGAAAQWAWKDDSGHVVFSDVPPPPGVKATDIIRRPAPAQPAEPAPDEPDRPASAGTAPAAAAPAAPPAAPAAAPKPATVADQEQAFRKRQKERADAEKKQADEAARAARDADNCKRAQGYQRMLEDSGPVVRTNADGTREMLDEGQRATELERARKAIAQSCK